MALQGIDVSNWQGDIALDKVPADFVIVKATEGTWLTDARLNRNYQLAKSAGRLMGVYHYAEGGNVREEADYFLAAVSKYIGQAILVLDWESQYNPVFGKNDKTWVKEFCDYVYEKVGVKPLVYVPASAMHRLDGIGDYGLWVAQYPDYERTGYQEHPWNEGAYLCAMRQYTSSGQLPGYNGRLDLNKFYGDRMAWERYATVKSKTTGEWVQTDKSWKYLENGVAVKGWKSIDNFYYYFDKDGNALTGWHKLDNGSGQIFWYYFHKTSFNMMVGWQKIEGQWYYFHLKGGNLMQGWQIIENKTYYLFPEGSSWGKVNNEWYDSVPKFGNLAIGWNRIKDKDNVFQDYYFDKNGELIP